MPQVVHLGGGGGARPEPPRAPKPGSTKGPGSGGLDDQKKLFLIIGLAVAILAGAGVTVFNAVASAPHDDGINATDRERQEEAKMTPEQRAAAQRAQEEGNKKPVQTDGAPP